MSPAPSLSSVWEPREGRAGRGCGDAGGSRGPGGRRQGGPRAPKAGSASPRLSPVGRRPSLPSWLREETTSSILSGPRGELGATPTRPGKPGLGPAARPPGRRPLPAPHLAPAGATGPGPDAAPASAGQDGGGCGSPSRAPACRKGWAAPGGAAASRPLGLCPRRPRGGRVDPVAGGNAGAGRAGPGRAGRVPTKEPPGRRDSAFVRRLHLCPGRTSRAVRVPRFHVGGERGGRPGGRRWDCSRRCWGVNGWIKWTQISGLPTSK